MKHRIRWIFVSMLFLALSPGALFSDKNKVEPKEEENALKVVIKNDGRMFIENNKEYDRTGIKEILRDRKNWPDLRDPADPRFANYPLSVKADGATDYRHIQWLLMASVRFGAITKVIFKDMDDPNRTYAVTLPREKGVAAAPSPTPNKTSEIRIRLQKGEKDQSPVRIEKELAGSLTASFGKEKAEADKALKENEKVWSLVADKVKTMMGRDSSADNRRDILVIIDAAENVPWEHIFNAIEILTKIDVKIEFAANLTFKDLYR